MLADKNYSRARDQFRRLLDIEARLRERTQAGADRDRWQRYEERALFSHADTYYLERDHRAAIGEYRKAVARYRESAWVPYGYYQLGQCEFQDGQREEAVRYFQLGLRKTQELPDAAFDDSPKGRDFWVETFKEKIRVHDREP